MINIMLELQSLRSILESKGLDSDVIDSILDKAREDINNAVQEIGMSALQSAVEVGTEKGSAEFVNQVMLDNIGMQITTESFNTSFSEPPKPMLPYLLQGAKPLKDGSGVYKVIPVGSPSRSPKPSIASNIYDAWKYENARRVEAARQNFENIAPRGSKAEFRTATSKQDANTQWVIPSKEKDFTEDLSQINEDFQDQLSDKIRDIIREYEESF
jgi:hypothetical protein